MVLTVTPTGALGWQQPGGIPNGTAGQWLTWDSAGKAAWAPAPVTPPELPTYTTADSGKVLEVTALGSIAWKDLPPAPKKTSHQETITFTPGTQITITHNLNDDYPVVTVWDLAVSGQMVGCEIAIDSPDSILVDSATAGPAVVSIVKAN
jgi:hypothetical protein